MILSSLVSLIVATTANVASISDQDVGDPVRFLASPELEGRLTLSAGATKASEYIAKAFRSAGLKPGEKKSYFHLFKVSLSQKPTKKCSLAFTLPGNKKISLKLNVDYRPLVNSTAKPVEAGLVFAGYGLERDNWNDFEKVDVKDKVVVMLRGLPAGQSPISTGSKARNAVDRGAIGVIFVGPTETGRSELPAYSRAQGMPPDLEVPGVGITQAFFKALTGEEFETARKATGPASRVLDIKVRMVAEMVSNTGMARNVIGILPGHDAALKNEVIVIGAHYDHLGYGEISSMTGSDLIHPGADDNASGSATVIALAKYFAQRKDNERTLIFELYQGEELGLLGSEAWAKEHPELIAKMSCMINIDMVGRLREGKLYAFGSGTAKEWDSIFKLTDVKGIDPIISPFVRSDSDQASFYRRNLPVTFFYTGLHPEYHSEKDTLATLNIPGMALVANYVAQVIHLADAVPHKMAFTSENTAAVGPQGSGQGRKVRIGFVPDMTDNGPGILLSGVSAGTPAEKAGLKAGDRITEFGGVKMTDLQSLQDQMMKVVAGAKVKVVFVRNGERKEVELTVEARE